MLKLAETTETAGWWTPEQQDCDLIQLSQSVVIRANKQPYTQSTIKLLSLKIIGIIKK